MDDINITCEELVALPCGLRMVQNIMFNPTEESVEAVQNAQNKGGWHTIRVKDNGGEHVSSRSHRILSMQRTRNVVIFNSSEG